MTTTRDRSPDGWLWLQPLEVNDPAEHPAVTTVPTSLPCPDWCELPAGHPFESTGGRHLSLVTPGQPTPDAADGDLLRVHRQRFGQRPTHVALETYERAASHEGPTDLDDDSDATLIRLQFPHACGYLTPDGARRLASMLTEAATAADGSGEPQ